MTDLDMIICCTGCNVYIRLLMLDNCLQKQYSVECGKRKFGMIFYLGRESMFSDQKSLHKHDAKLIKVGSNFRVSSQWNWPEMKKVSWLSLAGCCCGWKRASKFQKELSMKLLVGISEKLDERDRNTTSQPKGLIWCTGVDLFELS